MSNIPDGITSEDVRSAIADYAAGVVRHSFHKSEKYDILFEGGRYPPKAILGIAARRVAGRVLKPEDFSGGEGSRCFNVLRGLDFTIVPKPDAEAKEGEDWNEAEIDAAVGAYLSMLADELAGKPYSKAEVNRTLREGALINRSKGSVEYRMGNISAVLMKLNRRWIEGYKPAANVGRNVEKTILDSLSRLEAITQDDLTPEADPEKLEKKVRKARRVPLARSPDGVEEPKRVTRITESYERDPAVKAWVLDQSKGVCELCEKQAPFVGEDGYPFLEVHHAVPLADKGKDKTNNAVALCPNCHRLCHHSKDRAKAVSELYRKVSRLTP